jgi:isopentenyl-diphosphate delta-isomerase
VSASRETVSSPAESLILVDESDSEVGFASKAECHRGGGLLHRAFSVFLFNSEGQLLLQQRSAAKPLWPLYWSNSCCSHPRAGERIEDAARRRIREELSLQCELEFLYKFMYHAPFGELGSEREFCHVFAGRHTGRISAHPEEIAAWRYVTPDELTAEMAADPESFTPWLKLEWPEIRQDHLARILAS